MLTSGHQAADALTPFCWRKQKALSCHHNKSCFPVWPREIMLPRDVLFWAGPSACPLLPLHALLHLPHGTEWAVWAAVGYFRAFQAIFGSGCETLWAGRKGQALVSALIATPRLGMGTAGAWQGGGKPWDVHRKQPKESRGAAVAREDAQGRTVWREQCGECWRAAQIPWKHHPGDKGCVISCSRTAKLATPWPDPTAILAPRDCGAVGKVLAGHPRVLGSF